MKRNAFTAFTLILCLFFASAFSACGGASPTVLAINPAGPTAVLKGGTLQFTANLSDVSWSVQGGDANGTISNTGLYTSPTQIPVASNQVTVAAQSSGGQTATALVDLRSGNTLAFGSSLPINDAAVTNPGATFLTLIESPTSDRIAVRTGSLQVDALWPGNNTTLNLFYAQSLDLEGFSPERNLLPDSTNNLIATSIETDSQKNPGILFTSSNDLRVFFLGSDNQGVDFKPPVPIAPASPAGNLQQSGNARLDDEDRIHAVFTENDSTIMDGTKNVFYVKSEDSGATWSAPKAVSTAPNGTDGAVTPSVVVDPSGDKIGVCWSQKGFPGQIFFSFSTDGGTSFSTPKPVSSSTTAQGCRVARGPGGEIYVSYTEASSENVFIVKSTDGGDHFGLPIPVSADPATFLVLTLMAVDQLGRIDMVWVGENPDAPGNQAILGARSLNGGDTFSDPVPIVTSPDVLVATGLRHDDADRLYLQYWDINATSNELNVFLVVGE
ncbi:MAG TPA: hypothetical protein DF383_03950 [Deltaproteobacteria bacterium]|nr:hypothetical protein [Deltaproteobacteria bacterium]